MYKSSIITLVFIYISSIQALENLLHYVIDDVPAESYKYYNLMYDGLIKIRLTTQLGDADIYISQTTTKPTYDPEQYSLQSTTCGEDTIFIPPNFKRPVSIGVYGHPSHESSRYTLLIYQVINLNENVSDEQISIDENFQGSDNLKKEKKSLILTLLWSLIDLIIQVFF